MQTNKLKTYLLRIHPNALMAILFLSINMKQHVGKSQSVRCDSFSIIHAEMDNVIKRTINFTVYFAGNSSQFINYPHIAKLTNIQEDSIGGGTINSFGQFGNSGWVYSTTCNFDTFPKNFAGSVYFKFNDTTCRIPFQYSVVKINNMQNPGLIFFPNPVENELFFAHSLDVEIFNNKGMLCKKYSNARNANIGDLPTGVYFIKIIHGTSNTSVIQKLIKL